MAAKRIGSHYSRDVRGEKNPFFKHGAAGTQSRLRLYRTWTHIKGRCLNPNDHAYPRYGGRGITIAECWRDDFPAFRAAIVEVMRAELVETTTTLATLIEKRETGTLMDSLVRRCDVLAVAIETCDCPKGLSLDRVDNSRGYEPGNIRFATAMQQAQNTRQVRLLTHPETGETLCVSEWARRLGLNPASLTSRIDKLHWPIARALSPTRGRTRMITHPKTRETRRLVEWAAVTGIGTTTLLNRIDNLGWPIEAALDIPARKWGR